jgi:flagellar motor switch protein FliM
MINDELKNNSDTNENLDDLVEKSEIFQQPEKQFVSEDELKDLLSQKNENKIIDILNGDQTYQEKLPMLEIVFDRLVRYLSTSLRNFTSDNAEVSCTSIKTIKFSDYLNSVELPCMLGVFKASELENQGLLVLDGVFVTSMVDILLGGRKSPNKLQKIDNRPYTSIERNLLQRLILLILSDFTISFEPVSKINFTFERLETNPKFAIISREKNTVVVASLNVDMDERGGKIEIILPYPTIEPIRDILLQNFMGEKFGSDLVWENYITDHLWEADITLEATIDHSQLPLYEVMNWKVGTHIDLETSQETPIKLFCDKTPIFTGYMGKKDGHIAIKIEESIFEDKEKNHDN